MIKSELPPETVSNCGTRERYLKNPRFAGLNADAQALLSQYLRKQSFEKGSKIFSVGESLISIYIVESGFGKVSIQNRNNTEVFLSICGPGDSLGEFAVFNENKYPVNFTALTEMTAWVLGAREFKTLCEMSEAFSRGTGKVLYVRLTHLHERLISMSSSTVEKRIETFFQDLGARYGIRKDNHSLLIPFVLKRKELAQIANTTIETTIRILSKWHKDGKVLTGKNSIILTSKFFAC